MSGLTCAFCGDGEMWALFPGGSANHPLGTPACLRCAPGVLGLEDTREEEPDVSAGPGRLQRRIVEVAEAAPNRSMTRRELERILIAEGYDRSNLLRAIKGLADRRLVYVREGHTLDESRVYVPEPVQVISDEQIAELLRGLQP